MAPLSPAAQAVLDAAVLPCTIRQGIAAALRAAADQVCLSAMRTRGPTEEFFSTKSTILCEKSS